MSARPPLRRFDPREDENEREASPAPQLGSKSERELRKALLSRRLREALEERGWRAVDLVREAAGHLPQGCKLSPQQVSHYVSRRSFPSAPILVAMSEALGTDLSELSAPADAGREASKEYASRDSRNGPPAQHSPSRGLKDMQETPPNAEGSILVEDAGGGRAH